MDKKEMTVKMVKKSNKALPVIKNTKIKVNRNKVEGGNRVANGFIVLVEIEGKGWFNENAVLHHYGMKTVSGTFKTYKKAQEEVEKINNWGKVAVKESAKDKHRREAIEAMVETLVENGMNEASAKTIAEAASRKIAA